MREHDLRSAWLGWQCNVDESGARIVGCPAFQRRELTELRMAVSHYDILAAVVKILILTTVESGKLSSRPFLWDIPFNDWRFLSVAAFLTTINLQPPMHY